jgi:hypothetical protein
MYNSEEAGLLHQLKREDLPSDEYTLQWYVDGGVGKAKLPRLSGTEEVKRASSGTHCCISMRSANLTSDVATASKILDPNKLKEDKRCLQDSTEHTEPKNAKLPRFSGNQEVKPSSSGNDSSISDNDTGILHA